MLEKLFCFWYDTAFEKKNKNGTKHVSPAQYQDYLLSKVDPFSKAVTKMHKLNTS